MSRRSYDVTALAAEHGSRWNQGKERGPDAENSLGRRCRRECGDSGGTGGVSGYRDQVGSMSGRRESGPGTGMRDAQSAAELPGPERPHDRSRDFPAAQQESREAARGAAAQPGRTGWRGAGVPECAVASSARDSVADAEGRARKLRPHRLRSARGRAQFAGDLRPHTGADGDRESAVCQRSARRGEAGGSREGRGETVR